MTPLTFFSRNHVMVIFRVTHRVSMMFYSFLTSFTNTLSVEPHISIQWEDGDKLA